MTESERERIKHRANYANGVAIAVMGVIGIGFALTLLTDQARQGQSAWGALPFMLLGVLFSVAFHLLGNRHLKLLDKD